MKKVKSPPIRRTLTGHELTEMKKLDVYDPVSDAEQSPGNSMGSEIDDELTGVEVKSSHNTQSHDDLPSDEPVADPVPEAVKADEQVEIDQHEEPLQAIENEKVSGSKDKRGFWGVIKNDVKKPNVSSTHTPTPAEPAERSIPMNHENTFKPEKSNAIVSETMAIKGDVELQASLFVAGKIFGNVSCAALLETKLGSLIEGNVKANVASLLGGEIKGNVTCEENLSIEEATVVHGDLIANSVLISGTVTGNVTAKESVTLTKTAAVHGNLTSASISVESGATLEGQYTVRKNVE